MCKACITGLSGMDNPVHSLMDSPCITWGRYAPADAQPIHRVTHTGLNAAGYTPFTHHCGFGRNPSHSFHHAEGLSIGRGPVVPVTESSHAGQYRTGQRPAGEQHHREQSGRIQPPLSSSSTAFLSIFGTIQTA